MLLPFFAHKKMFSKHLLHVCMQTLGTLAYTKVKSLKAICITNMYSHCRRAFCDQVWRQNYV